MMDFDPRVIQYNKTHLQKAHDCYKIIIQEETSE